ncbi:MAG: glucuronate isomerase [Planctomycetales bacterium]|nr:glucuronate isomerase [Planctomycetales bacterium]
MSLELRQTIYDSLSSFDFVDPHTHINALQPAAKNLADILGYHYYTELAHSAGLARTQIEADGLSPKEKVGLLAENFAPLENTIQASWFIEIAREFFGFTEDRLTPDNWESLYDHSEQVMSAPDWSQQVLKKSRLTGVFLTNDFDDPLAGFDTNVYIPCLRTDDLVFHLSKPVVRERLAKASGTEARNATSVRNAITKLFEHFCANGARACAISLPPTFAPEPVADGAADAALAKVLAGGDVSAEHARTVSNFVFWTLTQHCAEFRLPFDLMIGVNRAVYREGVYQGQDLYDSRVSLIQYQRLLNAFPQVTFPISVLASVTNQELVSYAWIFPNVVTNGHWWYSNTPTYIEHDARARLEAVPQTKQIGYYSDMYKLEFALPKFNMYKRILAKILAEQFVQARGWSETRAIELGTKVLRDNTAQVFAANRS